MKRMVDRFAKPLCVLLIVSFVLLDVSVHTANAGLIGTETILNDRADHDPRARVAEFLAGEQVRKTMTGHGVSPEEVTARIAALSDAEIDRIAAELDSLPAGAGAGAVIGAVVLVFIVLLITDILGFTRVFPFTRPVR